VKVHCNWCEKETKQHRILSPQSNESGSAPSQQDEDEDEDEDDWENDSSSLVDSNNEDEDNIETDTLQDNRSIPSTIRIFLMNTGSEGEGFSSTSLYTDRDTSKSKQKLNVAKQQSKAPAAHKTRTSYNLRLNGDKLASVLFWKKTNLKKSTYVYIHDLNVPIPNTNPKTREEALTRPDTEKWIEVMKVSLMLSITRELSS
jgi:hypothetical protein